MIGLDTAPELGEAELKFVASVTAPLFWHVGGNALIPNATVIVQRREWQAGMDPDIAAQRGFNPQDFDLGHKVVQVDGEHDVFGDGSVTCLPTYGHTPGHQSLKLRLAGGEVVLAADSCYFCRTLRARRLPKNVHDRDAMHASLDRLARLEASGARIFFGHDGEWSSARAFSCTTRVRPALNPFSRFQLADGLSNRPRPVFATRAPDADAADYTSRRTR
jgi:glyoxylase-like metal-dependent hydrolase (beta-lactamase superfamily II)